MLGEKRLVLVAGVLAALVGVVQECVRWAALKDRHFKGLCNLWLPGSSSGICSSIAQPTRRRENKSSTPARYSDPSSVSIAVMSTNHFRLGASAVKSRSSRLHTERSWPSRWVVLTRRRGGLAFRP